MANTNDRAENVKTIRELLGIEDDFEFPATLIPPSPSGPAPALNMLVPEIEEEQSEAAEAEEQIEAVHEPIATEFTPIMHAKTRVAQYLGKDWVRYPLIFLVTLGFFYVVLNFSALTRQFTGLIFPPAENEQIVLGDKYSDFNTWVKKYYVYVNNEQVLAANADPDSDGLTNMDEFHLGTNPFRSDTDRDGTSDGREALDGTNPLYEGALLEYQRQAIAERLDKNAIASRLGYYNGLGVAGASLFSETSEQNGPAEPVNRFIVNIEKPGEISVPRLGILAPVVWSKEFKLMEEDLKWGTAHHPETPYPGERGTASIHGHSSGNWNDGDFKTVFTKINFLEPGDEVFVTVHSINGESRKYRFIVRSKKVYSKTDPAQFADMNGFFLNLSTSWPVGTARERYVVTTELAGL